MAKKSDKEKENQDTDTAKIWCPEKEIFQYIHVCEINCKKKDGCEAFRDYVEPKLF